MVIRSGRIALCSFSFCRRFAALDLSSWTAAEAALAFALALCGGGAGWLLYCEPCSGCRWGPSSCNAFRGPCRLDARVRLYDPSLPQPVRRSRQVPASRFALLRAHLLWSLHGARLLFVLHFSLVEGWVDGPGHHLAPGRLEECFGNSAGARRHLFAGDAFVPPVRNAISAFETPIHLRSFARLSPAGFITFDSRREPADAIRLPAAKLPQD